MPDIFDEISSTQSSSKGDIFDQIGAGPSRTRSLVSAPIKGAIKGAHELSELRDPIAALFGLNKMTPMQEKAIQMLFPTQDRPLEKGLERAGRIGISAIGGPETLLAKGARVAAGATLGQLAEEVGAPEWAQGLGELAGFASPRFSKTLLPKKSQQEAVEFLRKQGLSDKEIVPLVRSENFMNRWLTQFAGKGKRSEKLVAGAKEKFGQSYELLKESGKEKFLKGSDAVAFDDKLSEVLEKINPRFSRLIEKDVEALRNKEDSQKNLIDFYQDINAIVGGQEGGKAVLNILKKPILQGIEKIDPESAKQFSGLNRFYGKAQGFADQIKPGVIEKLLKGSKSLQLIGSLAGLKFGFLPAVLKTYAAQQVLRELALNPRLQNLTLQMQKSVAANKIPSALRTLKLFEQELRKTNSDLADKLVEKIDEHHESDSD